MVAVALVVTVIAWTIEAAMFYTIALAFPLQVGPLAALFGMGVANLGTMIPAAPGYVGTFDVPLAAVLELAFNVPRASAIGYTLVVHAALVVPVVLIGLLLIWREGLSLRSVAPPNAEREAVVTPRTTLAPQHAVEGTLWRTGETGGIVGQD
jgi:glycosyltransferase 2 family protein